MVDSIYFLSFVQYVYVLIKLFKDNLSFARRATRNNDVFSRFQCGDATFRYIKNKIYGGIMPIVLPPLNNIPKDISNLPVIQFLFSKFLTSTSNILIIILFIFYNDSLQLIETNENVLLV